ncbi:hypothetical protein K466DRAFT_585745 [Polyporus arcularius HHB13444]|uniref:Uncharacterized protein n=1 Tax=Polyporus arcularius HHB13444 TaxID=1314778 RepID=A0A5C3PIP4_9APHY|nr:hypothetical protein K466DRAFT_585745 [Polyporus arcularius HHB13444]
MSTRHSFLSTTGLIRPSSAMSTLSTADDYTTPSHARSGSTRPGRKPTAATPLRPPPPSSKPLTTRAGILPLGPGFLVGMAVTLSLLFILVIMCAFIPDTDETPAFAGMLNDIAANSPGIVLIGDDVDVDVDEPALTIRWSIIGCGPAYVLPGSEGTHGSHSCGLPGMSLHIFVDGAEEPAAVFDPSTLPFFTSGQRHGVQNMFQFDDDHVLDVHEARLYPFDTYHLTSTFKAVSTETDETLPIQKLATIPLTSSFVSISSDSSSVVKAANGSEQSSRDLDLQIIRPAEARAYALLLFGASWMLAHATVGLVALSWYLNDAGKVLKHLVSSFVVILLIPQLRNAMPDAPGFDGVLIDAIGFFPQMLVSAVSAIVLFGMVVKRELGYLEDSPPEREEHRKEAPAPLSTGLLRMRRGGASIDISHVRNFSRGISGFVRGSGL